MLALDILEDDMCSAKNELSWESNSNGRKTNCVGNRTPTGAPADFQERGNQANGATLEAILC
jgi:hypothetical protein